MDQQHVPWAAASMLVKRYGSDAPTKVAERLGELALACDMEGVAMLKQIAACMNQLSRPDRKGTQ